MRHVRLLAILACALGAAACINSTTIINVKADGSGTIEQTMTMNSQMAAQMQQMAASFGGKEGAPKKGGFFNEEELRAAAAKMGEGVTFVSATPIKTADAEGTKAIYAFRDITKLSINQKPAAPGGGSMGGGGGMAPVPGGTAAEDMGFRFTKTPAGTSKVTVVFPEPKMDAVKKATAPKGGQPNDPMQGAALAMMKQFFNGMKISIVMQPVGRIVKTNSPYVAGGQVTLMEIDFGQLMNDPAMLERLQSAGSIEEAKTLLKGVKGVKVNMDREVNVEFAAK